MCLDSAVRPDDMHKPVRIHFCISLICNVQNINNHQVGLWPCHGQGGNQYWLLSKEGELRRDEACLDFGGEEVRGAISVSHIISISCHHHQTIFILHTEVCFDCEKNVAGRIFIVVDIITISHPHHSLS